MVAVSHAAMLPTATATPSATFTPDRVQTSVVATLTAMRIYYESRGRPWEFQAMLKARVIAGDGAVGEEFLQYVSGLLLNPSVSGSPVDEIAAMRGRIRENITEREKAFNIKLMEGGIRDIEFVIQFLQLLNGGSLPEIRTGNTLEAIDRLEKAGCLTLPERSALAENYILLRRLEHRLQCMFDLQTHNLPENDDGSYEFVADGPESQKLDDGESATVVFTYSANDGTTATTETLTITIYGQNDAADPLPDTGTVNEDATLTVNATNGVLANDTDVDGDALTVSTSFVWTDIATAVFFRRRSRPESTKNPRPPAMMSVVMTRLIVTSPR